MTNESRRAGLARKVAAPFLAVAVLATGAHLWWNTNVFGPADVCGGLVPTDAAQAVFSASGRVSDRDGLADRSGDQLDFTCTVENTSLVPGSDTGRIRVSGSRERGDFPFTDDGRWPGPASMAFFSGGATGAVGADHGWVLLPDACTTSDGPAIIEGYAPQGSDPMQLTRLLTEVADNAAERADCAAGLHLTAPDRLPAAAEQRRVGNAAVCGVKGLEFPGVPERRAEATEKVQDGTGATWSCEVTKRATYAVTQEPHIVAGIRSSPGYTEQPHTAGHQLSGFDKHHVVADCGGTPTYFSLEFDEAYTSEVDAPDTPSTQDLFTNFIDAAGKQFGCSAAS
ncbi:hypothetical protein [Streptomyces sp. enrichment culture]|uniref:hypothetical protein n=1 Tax=Streptomyces sp. enrichment culture TaxID=1795815 RepID=UPI003F57DA94